MRIRMLAAAGLAAAGVLGTAAASGAAPAAPAPAPKLTWTLPAPTGPDAVGVVDLHLVDRSRPDPWTPAQPYRELMVSVWYPAEDVAAYPLAPQMLPAAAAHFDTQQDLYGWGIPAGKVDWAATKTAGHRGAPAKGGKSPVLLYSPGLGDPRTLGDGLAQDLASRGYVVVTVDHPGDATEVEFPGGRIVPLELPLDGDVEPVIRKALAARVADERFVLDQLQALADGRNPDVDGARLPAGLGRALDLSKVGAYGQSAGGSTAGEAMLADRRIDAGLNYDGSLGFAEQDRAEPVKPIDIAAQGVDRPYLLMGSQPDDHFTEPTWAYYWDHRRGWTRDLHVRGFAHRSFIDPAAMIEQLAGPLGLPEDKVVESIGTLPAAEQAALTRDYTAAYFDRFLRGRSDRGVFDRPWTRHPAVGIVR